jgi:hypothetical protein
MSRTLAVVALLLVAATGVVGVPAGSGATFVATTGNTASTVRAAADWTPPTVAVRSPGSPVKDTVTVTADAADAETGVASVVLQVLAPGASSWTTLCTATAAPYSCAWNTKAGVDGAFALRATATDRAGLSTTSETVATVVANNLLVQLANPGDIVRGSVPLVASLYNAGAVSYSVSIQYAPAGTTTWKQLCATSTAPYTCTWATAGSAFVQGDAYDLRAVATAGSSSTTSATITDVTVDNVAPTATMTDPGATLRGTITLAATAVDAETGVATVELQHQRSGTTTWTTACTVATEPFSCRWDTTAVVDGTYSFRAVAVDAAGNTTTSVVIANRVVDNTVSAVSMEDPGAFLTGTVTLAATASSTAGVASVRIDRAPSGTTTWTAVCTDTAAPYSCSWDTTGVADGLYDFRAVLVDGKGATTISATLAARRVDSSPLRGWDVQAVNGGANAGRLDAGDTIRLTWTEPVDLATITPGWTGASLPVTLRLRDGMALGLGSRGDSLDVQRNGVAVNLGSVNLKQDFVKNNKAATFNATITATTTTVNGVGATQVLITVGTVTGGANVLRTATAAGTMTWTPSTLATSLAGRPCSGAPVAELGVLDRDL